MFKNLSDEDKQQLIEIYHRKDLTWDERTDLARSIFNVTERRIRVWWVKLGCKTKKDSIPEQYEIAKGKKLNENKQVFFVTWGQNNTKVHKELFENMKAYAEVRNASIHVIAGRYKNPTSVNTDAKYEFWANELLPYLDANRHKVHDRLHVLSDIKIQPTATNPMSGMEGVSGSDCCVFGSPKVHLEAIPSLGDSMPKLMLTTGACTVKNYTDSKAGKKGEFHHTLGFVIIELDGEHFHVRQVTASNDGSFYDLIYHVKNQLCLYNNSCSAIVLGDIHVGDTCPSLMRATRQLLDKIKPDRTVIHDLFNGESISHHDSKDPIRQYQKEKKGTNSLDREIKLMKIWIESMKRYNLVVVRSNHDDWIDRWICNVDWKKDIKNSYEYITYTKALLDGNAPKGIIPYIIDNTFNDVITLDRDESFIVNGWELGVHGDIGQHGMKGSPLQFRRLNSKMITGHGHSPIRKDGFLQVGTSTKRRVGYNKGASNWMNSHVIVYPNGKAQHIHLTNKKFSTIWDTK